MKKRNILSNIAKVMAGSLLAATVLTAISPAMAAYADVTDGSADESAQVAEDNSSNQKSDVTRTFPDGTRSASITVTLKCGDEVVAGDSLSVYKVAEVYVENGFNMRYIGDFATLAEDTTFKDSLTDDASLADGIGKGLADKAKEMAKTAKDTKTVNDKGVAVFNFDEKPSDENKYPNLGLYLIVQTKMTDANIEKYAPINPFLVTVPYYDSENEIHYDVDAAPKVPAVKKLSSCKADPPVRKIVVDKDASTGEDFLFAFRSESASYPMPDSAIPAGARVGVSDDKRIHYLKVTTDSKTSEGYPTGMVEAGVIEFDAAGDYTYTYREISDSETLAKYGCKLYDYDYASTVYYITYHVIIGTGENAGKLVIESVDARIGGPSGEFYENSPYTPSPSSATFNDPTFASAKVVEFVYRNYPTDDDIPPRRKQSETTDRERSTVGPPAEFPTVAGAYRDPGDEGEVLGAARTPQAVLGASRLPQTGQLWWPVPILMIAGIALMAGGLVKRKSEE